MIAPTLHTDRLTLRAPAARDLEAFIDFFTSDRAALGGNQMGEADAWRLFAAVIGHWHLRGFGMWTLTRRGADTPAGLVGCLQFPEWPEREIGWFLWDGFTGQGYATEAARAVRAHAYAVLGWTTAVSYIGVNNAPSIRLAERLGAIPEPDAPYPGVEPSVVYRHPAPEAVQ